MEPHQVAIVTGAGSGRAVAVELARAGHIVYAGMRDLPERVARIPERLRAIDLANDPSPAQMESVGRVLAEVLKKPRGERPRRVVVDAQHKGVEELDAVRAAKQLTFFRHLGIDDLLTVAVPTTPIEEKR